MMPERYITRHSLRKRKVTPGDTILLQTTHIVSGMEKKRYSKTYVREWRKKRNLSLRKLADRLETEPGGDTLLSYASIGRIERGEQPYTQETIEALAQALGVSVTMLLTMNPEKEGEVVDLLGKLDEAKRDQALEYIRFLATK